MSDFGRWIALPSDAPSQAGKANTHGESLSPYDVPDAFRVFSTPGRADYVTIEFRYISSDEPTEEVRVKDVVLVVGKSSRRLYQLSVASPDVRRERAATVAKEKLSSALSEFTRRDPRGPRVGNYRMARDVLNERAADAAMSQAVGA